MVSCAPPCRVATVRIANRDELRKGLTLPCSGEYAHRAESIAPNEKWPVAYLRNR
jgi:hypothetical protein